MNKNIFFDDGGGSDMLKGRHKFEDEDEVYIPDLGDGGFSDDFNLHDRTPRSNAGIGLGWSGS